ncbi:ribonuclease HII [Fulvivirga lutimaris]|uniref:ribonuclease HII n=1 Tax=Fulvivirga lutimaris TaxID=1819566 RepID=UPI0012BB7D14|nr:ribonuclease HII [Fulvivirga lutimaris]MTI40534.1 ribonuclease HII [Fulvivirga lutimaris]
MLLSSFSENLVEAGCDEAGRGCLAGPVVAAAVILPPNYSHQLLNDSKKLSEKQRLLLKEDIIADALAWAVSFVDNVEIDEVNILNASFLAMNRSVEKLKTQPELLLIDGNRYKPHNEIPFECIIKGDGKYLSIAAASILAKTFRDEYMEKLSIEFPQYQWQKNKGYPTKAHRLAIAEIGLTDYHRKSFRQLPDQLTLFD